MSGFEKISALMANVGPVADLVHVAELTGLQAWMVAVDEDATFTIELSDDLGVLVLTSELGPPQAKDLASFYALLLGYSSLVSETDGCHFGLDPQSKDVRLLCTISADGIDMDRLSGLLTTFAKRASAWRKIVESSSPDTAMPLSFSNDYLFRA